MGNLPGHAKATLLIIQYGKQQNLPYPELSSLRGSWLFRQPHPTPPILQLHLQQLCLLHEWRHLQQSWTCRPSIFNPLYRYRLTSLAGLPGLQRCRRPLCLLQQRLFTALHRLICFRASLRQCVATHQRRAREGWHVYDWVCGPNAAPAS